MCRPAISSAVLCGLLLALLTARPSPSVAAIIKLKEQATIAHSVITLGDIAEIRDADAAEEERLRQLELAPAPASGGQRQLGFSSIRTRLHALGVNPNQIEISGSSVVTVTAAGTAAASRNQSEKTVRSATTDWRARRAAELIGEAVAQHLKRQAPELGELHVQASVPAEQVPAVLEGGVAGYQILGGSEPWDRPQAFTVRFLDRTETLHELQVDCTIRQRPFVVAARHTVPRGTVLREDDLVWRQVSGVNGQATRMEEVIGRETTRIIRRDEPISASAIQSIPLVRVNDIVTAYVRLPGVTVKRQFKARTSGAAGELITLVSLDGREKLAARVSGYHEAEVVGAGSVADAETTQRSGRIEFRTQTAGQPAPGANRTPGRRPIVPAGHTIPRSQSLPR